MNLLTKQKYTHIYINRKSRCHARKMDNISRGMESVKNNKKEMLEIKDTVTEL